MHTLSMKYHTQSLATLKVYHPMFRSAHSLEFAIVDYYLLLLCSARGSIHSL